MEEKKIILLSDFIDTRIRKEKELEFYQKQLEDIQQKMYWLNRDLDLTNTIIELIENENVVDIRAHLLERK
ncbi:MAG: hypothetical protein VW270_22805 [Candidatus Poseidoniales archaeon]